jgi:hypothetical protein
MWLSVLESTVESEIIGDESSLIRVLRDLRNLQEKSPFSLTDLRFSLILNLKSGKHA